MFVEKNVNGMLFAHDTALMVDSQEKLRQLVEEFGRIYVKEGNLRVNVSESKVMKCNRIVMIEE